MYMWYVIRVTSGKEDEAIFFMEKLLDLKTLGRAFIPKVVRKRKYKDGWRDKYFPFVPGYIFFETEDPKTLFFELKKVPKRTSLLRSDDEILAVSQEEESFIRSFLDPDDVVDVSTVYKEGDRIRIVSGPLVGKEALIKKIVLHTLTATISTEMFGRSDMELKVGLKLISDSKLISEEDDNKAGD